MLPGMSYIDTVLSPGETLEYRARISLWSFLASFAWMAILLGGTVVFTSIRGMENMGYFLLMVALGVGARVAIYYYGTELGLTDRRVIAKTGFIRRDTIEITLGKIESIQIAQSIPGRIFNYGTITMAGTGASHAPIRGIAAPLKFRRTFADLTAHTRAG